MPKGLWASGLWCGPVRGVKDEWKPCAEAAETRGAHG